MANCFRFLVLFMFVCSSALAVKMRRFEYSENPERDSDQETNNAEFYWRKSRMFSDVNLAKENDEREYESDKRNIHASNRGENYDEVDGLGKKASRYYDREEHTRGFQEKRGQTFDTTDKNFPRKKEKALKNFSKKSRRDKSLDSNNMQSLYVKRFVKAEMQKNHAKRFGKIMVKINPKKKTNITTHGRDFTATSGLENENDNALEEYALNEREKVDANSKSLEKVHFYRNHGENIDAKRTNQKLDSLDENEEAEDVGDRRLDSTSIGKRVRTSESADVKDIKDVERSADENTRNGNAESQKQEMRGDSLRKAADTKFKRVQSKRKWQKRFSSYETPADENTRRANMPRSYSNERRGKRYSDTRETNEMTKRITGTELDADVHINNKADVDITGLGFGKEDKKYPRGFTTNEKESKRYGKATKKDSSEVDSYDLQDYEIKQRAKGADIKTNDQNTETSEATKNLKRDERQERLEEANFVGKRNYGRRLSHASESNAAVRENRDEMVSEVRERSGSFGKKKLIHHMKELAIEQREDRKREKPLSSWCPRVLLPIIHVDVGNSQETEKCCYEHAQCPLIRIMGDAARDCQCEELFYACLKRSKTAVSYYVGNRYFNLLTPKCYRYHQGSTCSGRLCRSSHNIQQSTAPHF